MIITSQVLEAVFTGFKASYAKGFEGAAPAWPQIAMKVSSNTESETYGWLAQFPKMREWLGDRLIKSIAAKGMKLTSRDFESTIGVPRNKIMDDTYGIFSPIFEEMGKTAAEHPDELIFSLLARGWTERCYDGQYFFDKEHPVGMGGGINKDILVANTDGGTGAPWFLVDNSRAVRPLIYQERMKPVFTSKDQLSDDNVFYHKEFIYGIDSREEAGFGLWQLAWGSRQALNTANYETARTALQSMRGDEGRPLGIKPTTLIVGPALEGAAKRLITATTLENGQSNPWKDSVEIVVSPWVAAP